MPIYYSSPYPYQQYSGIWKVSDAAQNVGKNTWAGPNLFTWGTNPYGQLGLGNITTYSSPKQVGSLNWSQLSGNQSSLGVKKDGTLWSWGNNSKGQLGLGSVTNYSSPKQVGTLTNWKSVFSSVSLSMAVKTDGTLWGWGNNSNGQLGLGSNSNYYSSPKQVGSSTSWSTIFSGGDIDIFVLKLFLLNS